MAPPPPAAALWRRRKTSAFLGPTYVSCRSSERRTTMNLVRYLLGIFGPRSDARSAKEIAREIVSHCARRLKKDHAAALQRLGTELCQHLQTPVVQELINRLEERLQQGDPEALQ